MAAILDAKIRFWFGFLELSDVEESMSWKDSVCM